jgi:hypothetical protein
MSHIVNIQILENVRDETEELEKVLSSNTSSEKKQGAYKRLCLLEKYLLSNRLIRESECFYYGKNYKSLPSMQG